VLKRYGFLVVLMFVGTLAAQQPTPTQPAGGGAQPGGEVEMAWKFKQGDEFFQKLTTTTDQKMKTGNLEVTQKQEQTFVIGWKVLTKTDAEAVLEQKILSVAMKITIQGNEIKYDSTAKDAENNPLANFFKPIIGTTFKITLDLKKMEVTKVEGREDFVRKLSDSNPLIGDMLKKILTDDQLKKMSEPAFTMLPPKKVKAGEKWPRKGEMSMGPIGSYSAEYEYTYTGPNPQNKNWQNINVTTKLNWKAPDPKEASTLPFKIEAGKLSTTEASGTIVFDNDKGRVVSQKMTVKIKGELEISVGGDQKGEKGKVDLDQTQNTTTETLDKNPNAPTGATPTTPPEPGK
jgi:hypothetical protein